MDRLYGSRLRSVRTERKLRQVDVAAGLGMTAGGYSSIERGYARMFVADLPRYAEALGVAPEYLARRLGCVATTRAPTSPRCWSGASARTWGLLWWSLTAYW
jgi:transcriptional regulator with XRE-family HTH domain